MVLTCRARVMQGPARSGTGFYAPKSLGDPTKPSECIAYLDSGVYASSYSLVETPQPAIWYLPGTAPAGAARWASTSDTGNFMDKDWRSGRHNGMNNVCYMDGHVKAVAGAAFWNHPEWWDPYAQ